MSSNFEVSEYLKQLSRKGLYPGASWPADHGDNSRSKFFPGGLNINPSQPLDTQLEVTTCLTPELDTPQILYTREKDQVYVSGGKVSARYLALVNIKTMKVEQRYQFLPAQYHGGALIHENGDVYAVNGRMLYRFKNGVLKDPQIKMLPNINGDRCTTTNGLLTLENGILVAKMWGFSLVDMLKLTGVSLVKKALPHLGVFAGLVLFELLIFGSTYLFTTCFFALVLLIAGFLLHDELVMRKIIKPSSSGSVFLFRNLFISQPGIFLLIDPITLEIIFQDEIPDRSSGARLTISQRQDDQQEIAYLGDFFIQKFIYSYKDGSCRRVEEWKRRYRTEEERSTAGTGPTTIGRTVYFTNNTFPEYFFTHNFTLFSIDLDDPDNFKSYKVTPKDKQGFMWWSVVSNPKHNTFLIWDSLASRVLCFDRQLNLVWVANNVYNSDCMVCSPTKNHIYCTDVGRPYPSIREAWDWQTEASIHFKHLLILDAGTGSTLGKIKLTQEPTTIRSCNLMIGNNNDVFVGVDTGLIRISSKNQDSE